MRVRILFSEKYKCGPTHKGMHITSRCKENQSQLKTHIEVEKEFLKIKPIKLPTSLEAI